MSNDGSGVKSTARLVDFLRSNQPDIVSEWCNRTHSLAPARELSHLALVDHLPQILSRIAAIAESTDGIPPDSLADIQKQHAVDRLKRGFDLAHVVMEYALLRRTILDLWEARVGDAIGIGELRKLDAAFDESVRQATIEFAQARGKLLSAIDRVSEMALASPDLDPFLNNLLQVVLEGTEAADTCVIFLCESDRLYVRAAAGLEKELPRGYSLSIGESFAGQIAQQRRPLAITNASENPIITAPLIRRSGVRALYGVPMLRANHLLGVGVIGSRSASDFSEEDKLLFRSVVHRATSAIVKSKAFSELAHSDAGHRFLSEAGHEFSKSLDFEATLTKVAQLAVPVIADWCAVDRCEGKRIRRVATAYADPVKAVMAEALAQRFAKDGNRGVGRVFREATTEWRPEIPETDITAAARDAGQFDMVRGMSLKSYIIVPVALQGQVNCTITLLTGESGRRFSESDVRIAEQLADRAAAALENIRLFAAAQHATSAREQILAIVAHDLRNQLMIIGTSAALLMEKSAPSDNGHMQKTTGRILRTIGTMRRLLDDLVDIGAIEAGKLSFNPEPVAVAELLQEAIEAYRSPARERGLKLKLESTDRALRVKADPKRVMQVLSNLLGNAIKFTPPGGMIALRADASDAEVKFSVRDTGPGISESDLATLFEPYNVVAHSARSGSGLGLYIAKTIVLQHGGRIWASSQIGKGATFSFTLPEAK